jgi:hypothetical protein
LTGIEIFLCVIDDTISIVIHAELDRAAIALPLGIVDLDDRAGFEHIEDVVGRPADQAAVRGRDGLRGPPIGDLTLQVGVDVPKSG